MNITEFKNIAGEYPYRIDLHTHTSPASPCSELAPARLVEMYHDAGLDGIVVTNHFFTKIFKSDDPEEAARIYLEDYHKAKEAGEKCGLKVYLGTELRFPENDNDYLVYGVTEDDLPAFAQAVRGDYPHFYREVKTPAQLAMQAHPFRNGMVLQDASLMDGIEVYNLHPHHNSRIAFAAAFARSHPELVIGGGTDCHHEGHQGCCAVRFRALPADSVELAAMLRSRDYIFEINGGIIIP